MLRLHRFIYLATLTAPLLSGCGLLYERNVTGENYKLYSNRSKEYVQEARVLIDETYEAYLPLFGLSRSQLGRTKIFLDGDEDHIVDHSYSPSLLGYYVPLFNIIRVDTEPAWAEKGDSLKQVLMHEIAHHFFVTKYPEVADECWLNEGLAGNLEVSLIRGETREYPLIHPILVRIAQKASSRNAPGLSLDSILGKSWKAFHESDEKVSHYALSWSIVYYILERELPSSMSLGEKIDALYHMDRQRIRAMESSWKLFLEEFDLTELLTRWASSRDSRQQLTSVWAIGKMGEIYSLDDTRSLRTIESLLDDNRHEVREAACTTFLRILDRNPHVSLFARHTTRRGLDYLLNLVSDEKESIVLRQRLIESLTATAPHRSRWIRELIPILEDGPPELRSSAAQALARIAAKPTIVNPEFWEYAPVATREQEIGEWKDWLRRRTRDM